MDTLPDHISPMLSTLVPDPPDGDNWIHEIKHDGYRLLCRKDDEDVRLYTRNGHNWTERFPGIVDAVLEMLPQCFWMDGEIVVMNADGTTCFGSLQEAVHRRDRSCLAFYIFDLMHLDGEDLRHVHLVERKRILKEIVPPLWNLKYVDYIEGHGREFFRQCCSVRLEGIISKKAESPYISGRTREWVKTKCRGYGAFRTGNWENWKKRAL